MFDQVIHNIYTLSTVEYTRSALQIYDFVAINFYFAVEDIKKHNFFNMSFSVSFLELRTLF